MGGGEVQAVVLELVAQLTQERLLCILEQQEAPLYMRLSNQ